MSFLRLTPKGVKELRQSHPLLADAELPDTHTGATVRLSNGRALGYAEYVDASRKSEELFPVVLIPGTPGSRLFVHPDVRAAGHVPGWRLVVLERPGVGLSDPPPPGYTYRDFASDFREFCSLLGLCSHGHGRVAVVGYSAGTPWAATLAAQCGVELLAGVGLVAPIGPPDTPHKHQGMALLFRIMFWACSHLPWLVAWVVRSEAAAALRRPVHTLRQSFAPYSAPADVQTLKRPEVEEAFLRSMLECYLRGQLALHELTLLARLWGVDLTACHVPVAVWQGAKDRGCTVPMARHVAQQLAGGPGAVVGTGVRVGEAGVEKGAEKGAEGGGGGAGEGGNVGSRCRVALEVVPEAGHMVFFDKWKEIVAWVDGLRGGARAGGGVEEPGVDGEALGGDV